MKNEDLKLDRTIQVYFVESQRRSVEGSEQERREEGGKTRKRKETEEGEGRGFCGNGAMRELTNGGRKHIYPQTPEPTTGYLSSRT